MSDNIFDGMQEPAQRLQQHIQALDGVHHHYQRSPLDPLPGQPIQIILSTGGKHPYDAARCFFTTDGSDPGSDSTSTLDLRPVSVEWDTPSWKIFRTWSACLPPQPKETLIRYKMAARRVDNGQWVDADEGATFALWVDHDPTPAWAHEAVIYQIFPDRFYPGDGLTWKKTESLEDIKGGTLRGIIDKLTYIQALGFNTIWLNPFFIAPSHHRYDAKDYFTVDPALGTSEDLVELIETAHTLGMRLILDFVANHWSKDHFTFQDARKNRNSPYHDWYTWITWPHEYKCFYNVRNLPEINLTNPGARAYMLEAARYWLRAGFDAYRLDYAHGPTPDFWVDFRRACREVKPDCWIFGEIIHTPEKQRSYTGIMDGILDFHLASSLRFTFALNQMSLAEFEAFLSDQEAYFSPELIRLSFLDNHDETRFLFLSEGEPCKLKLAALIQYTLSGPPIVYAGDETGLSQKRSNFQNDHNNLVEGRLPMNWETADASLQEYYRHLNQLRRKYPVLHSGSRQVVHLNAETETYAYLRSDAESRILVAINTSKSAHAVSIDNSGFTSAVDLLNNNPVEIHGEQLLIHLPPQSGAFIVP